MTSGTVLNDVRYRKGIKLELGIHEFGQLTQKGKTAEIKKGDWGGFTPVLCTFTSASGFSHSRY